MTIERQAQRERGLIDTQQLPVTAELETPLTTDQPTYGRKTSTVNPSRKNKLRL